MNPRQTARLAVTVTVVGTQPTAATEPPVSYDLVFWKQSSACTGPPSRIHGLLLDGAIPDGIEEIPIEKLLDRVREAFPGVMEVGGLVGITGCLR
jgi:hypothetical protein